MYFIVWCDYDGNDLNYAVEQYADIAHLVRRHKELEHIGLTVVGIFQGERLDTVTGETKDKTGE